MKVFLIAVLLLPGYALTGWAAETTPNWVKTSESETGTAYIDPATIRKSGRKATMWELTDYRVAPNPRNPYLSVTRHYEFDCDEQALRTLTITAFAGKMGNGDVVLSVTEPAKWFLLAPGSVGDVMWQTACKRR